LGQSAATAAAQAIDVKQAIQDIDYPQLRKRLLHDKQVLVWEGPRRDPPIRSAALPGVVVDDRDAKMTLGWKNSSSNSPYVDYGYQHDGNANKGNQKVTFSADLPNDGLYEVRVYYAAGSNRATNTPYTVMTSGGSKTIKVNQRKKPNQDKFHLLGRFPFEKGKREILMISNQGTDGHVIVDALQLVPVDKN